MSAKLFLEEGERTCWLCGGEGEEEDSFGETLGCKECAGKGHTDETDNHDIDWNRIRAWMIERERRCGRNLRVIDNQLSNHQRLQETPRVILLPDSPIGITATLVNSAFRNAPDPFGMALENARTQAKGWIL